MRIAVVVSISVPLESHFSRLASGIARGPSCAKLNGTGEFDCFLLTKIRRNRNSRDDGAEVGGRMTALRIADCSPFPPGDSDTKLSMTSLERIASILSPWLQYT